MIKLTYGDVNTPKSLWVSLHAIASIKPAAPHLHDMGVYSIVTLKRRDQVFWVFESPEEILGGDR